MTVNKVAALGLGLGSSSFGPLGSCFVLLLGICRVLQDCIDGARGKGKGPCFPISITLWGQHEPQVSHHTGAPFQCQPPPWPRGRRIGPCVCVLFEEQLSVAAREG